MTAIFNSFLNFFLDFKSNVRPRLKEDPAKKDTSESANILYEGRKLVVNASKSRINLLNSTQGKTRFIDLAPVGKVSNCTRFKILTPKPMLRRLPVGLAQVKTGNPSENLLNEIGHIIYYLYWAAKINKKVYNNMMKSIKL